jgi:hypothetical protein
MTRLIALALGIAGVLTSGCGGPGDVRASSAEQAPVATSHPSAAAAARPIETIDPCAMIDIGELASGFGEIKEGPVAGTGLRNERQCNYTNTAGSWLKLSLYSGADRWEWERGITNAQNPRDVAGLADEAFAIKRGTDSVVYVRAAESILELSCSCSSEVAESLARKAASKL